MAGIFPNTVDGGVVPASVPYSYNPAIAPVTTDALYFNPIGCQNYLRPEFLNNIISLLAAPIDLSLMAIDRTDPTQLFRSMRRSGGEYYNTATGTANAISVTSTPTFASLAQLLGVPLRIKIATTNTGAVTVNVSGLGAQALVYPGDNTPMLAGELIAGAVRTVAWDGTNFQLIDAGSRPRKGIRGMQLFVTSGTFNPATYGLTIHDPILWLIWGGGGGGSSTFSTWGGAGGAGGFAAKFGKAPAASVAVTVGIGGAGNNSGLAGGNGLSSSVAGYASATGGIGGTAGGGAGGNGVGGDINIPGGEGGDVINDVISFTPGGAAAFMGSGTVGAPAGNYPIGSGGWARSNGPDAASGNSGAVIAIF